MTMVLVMHAAIATFVYVVVDPYLKCDDFYSFGSPNKLVWPQDLSDEEFRQFFGM